MAIKIETQFGNKYFCIDELDNLSAAQDEYRRTKLISDRDKYFDTFHICLQFITAYADNHIGSNTLTDDQIAHEIFVSPSSLSRKIYAYLSAMKTYAAFMSSTMNDPKMMDNADSLVFMMLSDSELLVILTEHHVNHIDAQRRFISNRIKNAQDIRWAINQLFSLPQSLSQNYINTGDLQPVATFLIRQFIETIVYNALGIKSVKHKNKPKHGLLSKTIKFFCNSHQHVGFSIQQPLNKDCLQAIYKWTNHYIHTGNQAPYYIVFFAWTYVYKLLALASTPIQIYTGKTSSSTMYGDIRISNYNTMKKAYEQAINTNPKEKLTVDWMPLDEVRAYIISL